MSNGTDRYTSDTYRWECAECGETGGKGVPCCPECGSVELGEPTFDMKRTARWHGIAESNIEKWGLQDEETLLLAMQEELGELTQAHLEARHEGGHELRIDEELDDLGALLIQLVKSRKARSLHTDTGRSEGD